MADQPQDRWSSGISVRVFGMDAGNKPFSRPAQALPISNTRACLHGIDAALRVGDIVGVQFGTGKARFRITSIGTVGSSVANQIEVESIDASQNIWTCMMSAQFSPSVKTELPRTHGSTPSAVVGSPQPSGSVLKQERRRFERYKCDFGAVVEFEGGKRLWARCSDVSIGGCYLETWSPLPFGANFRLELEGIAITAVVSTCHPNVGMGVRFLNVTAPQRLKAIIERLRHPTRVGN